MARALFFVFAAAFCISGCFPLRSVSSGGWTDFTLAIVSQDCPPGIYYDRQFDGPTGDLSIDVPVWAVDAALFALASVAFAFYARERLGTAAKKV